VRHPQEQETANAPDAFVELFELLETYAPTWYTEEHHHRAVAALRVRGSQELHLNWRASVSTGRVTPKRQP
jgi:hypothetical protein